MAFAGFFVFAEGSFFVFLFSAAIGFAAVGRADAADEEDEEEEARA